MLCRSVKLVKLFSLSCPSSSSIYLFHISQHCKFSSSRNPYDVLGLKNTCTTKDVKKAYIKLCQELHPDKKPNDTSQHEKFVELNEAYTILVIETSRKQFDYSANETFSNTQRGFHYHYGRKSEGFNKRPSEDSETWYEQDVKKERQKYYYRQQQNSHITFQANSWILYSYFVLAVTGFMLFSSSYSYARYASRRVDERSRRIKEDFYKNMKQDAENENEEPIERLKRKWNQ